MVKDLVYLFIHEIIEMKFNCELGQI